jgi:alpha-mannosidase
MASTLTLTTRALRGMAGVVDTARVAGPQPAPADVPTLFLNGTRGGGAGIAAAEGRLSQYDTHDDSPARPFVVFNLTAVERREVVHLTIWDREPWGTPVRFHDKSFEAVDARGRVLPVQVIEKSKGWGHLNMTLAVPLEVPALGFTTVVLRETLSPACPAGDAAQLSKPHHCSYAVRERMPSGIENKHVRVQFDMHTGRIVSFLDKRTGLDLVDAATGGIGLEISVERPHPMSAWCIEHSGTPERPALKSLREIQQGPYTAATEVVYAMRESTAKVVFRLDQDDPRLHVTLDVDWFQRGSATEGVPNLRLAIPLALADAKASYEIPFGAVARDTPPDQEVPALRWAKVAGRIGKERTGMLVLNDCKHGHALAGSTLRVNLIRSACEPDPLPEIGRHPMYFALVPVDADLSTAQATRLAQAFCSPLLPTGTGVHRGKLPPAATLIDVRGDDVVLSGIKFSEKGDGLIARLYETAGAPAKAAVGIDPAIASPVEAKRVDLMERPLKDASKPAITTRAVKFDVPAFGIGSVWIKTRRGK